MTAPLRLLLLEDSPADAELNLHCLRKAGLVFVSLIVEEEAPFIAALDDFKPDLIPAAPSARTWRCRPCTRGPTTTS